MTDGPRVAGAAVRSSRPAASAAREYVSGHADQLSRTLADWVRIPSVAGDPEHADALHGSAEFLAARFRELGFPQVEVWPQGDSFAVFAEWRVDAALPTVLVYSHHDVRAVRGERWTQTSPFEPVTRAGRLYGRGASDAKGQVCAHLLGLAAHLADDAAPAVNVRFLVEGEEELGSPNLADLLAQHGDRMRADLVVFTDTMLLEPDRPAVCVSVRGMVGATLTVRGPDLDVHSGTVSGTSPNPIHDLARVIAALHDDEGRLTVPGIAGPGGRRRAEPDPPSATIDPHDWVVATETHHDAGDPDLPVGARLWDRAAIEVISVQGGDTDGLPRAVIPREATARVSIRLAGEQRPEDAATAFRSWVEPQLRGIRYDLEFDLITAQPPYRSPDHPAVDALAEAMAVAFDVDRVGRMGNGGGGPVDLLARTTGAPVVFFGTGLPSDHWHAPDEHAHLDVVERGAVALAEFWRRLPAALA